MSSFIPFALSLLDVVERNTGKSTLKTGGRKFNLNLDGYGERNVGAAPQSRPRKCRTPNHSSLRHISVPPSMRPFTNTSYNGRITL